MKNLQQFRFSSLFVLAMTLLMIATAIPVMAQLSEECKFHLPIDGVGTTGIHYENFTVQDRDASDGKLRIQVYYPDIPAGLTQDQWESMIILNVSMTDTALVNTCVRPTYGNLDIRVNRVTNVNFPNDLDLVYNDAAISVNGVLKQMWQSEYSCFKPHTILFLTPIGATGPRGTATVMNLSYIAAGNTGIAVVKCEQVYMATKTAAHEIGHNLGGFHPGDTFADDPSKCGFGTDNNGHTSLMKSPTGPMTILTEGRIQGCATALDNGLSDVGRWWSLSLDKYLEVNPSLTVNTLQNVFQIDVDSSFSAEAISNWEGSSFNWYLNGALISTTQDLNFVPTISDTSKLVTFDLVVTTCSGQIYEGNVSVYVIAPTINTTGTNEEDVFAQLQISPNPTSDFIRLNGLNIGDQVQIFSSDGRLVIQSKETEIDLSPFSKGLYFLKVIRDNTSTVKKIVKL